MFVCFFYLNMIITNYLSKDLGIVFLAAAAEEAKKKYLRESYVNWLLKKSISQHLL